MLFIGVCFLGFLAHILAEENLHINMDLTGLNKGKNLAQTAQENRQTK
jgi:hypothetical protein